MIYIVVGWYAIDPTDANVPPFARIVEVEAETEHLAYDRGFDVLCKGSHGREGELLNWYIKAK